MRTCGDWSSPPKTKLFRHSHIKRATTATNWSSSPSIRSPSTHNTCLKDPSIEGHLFIKFEHKDRTPTAAEHRHNICPIVSSATPRIGHKESETIPLLQRLKRAGKISLQACHKNVFTTIRWGSHFHSICSVLMMFNPTCVVLENIIEEGSTNSQRGDANVAYTMTTSFKFIFILHLMRESWVLLIVFVSICNKISRHLECYAVSF